jgi:hypothetical protein
MQNNKRFYQPNNWPWKSIKHPDCTSEPKKTMKVCKDRSLSVDLFELSNNLEVWVKFNLSDISLRRNDSGFIIRDEKERLQKILREALEKWEIEP